jgi:hypothetical protein
MDRWQQYVELYYTYRYEISQLLDSNNGLKIQVAAVEVEALHLLNLLLAGFMPIY